MNRQACFSIQDKHVTVFLSVRPPDPPDSNRLMLFSPLTTDNTTMACFERLNFQRSQTLKIGDQSFDLVEGLKMNYSAPSLGMHGEIQSSLNNIKEGEMFDVGLHCSPLRYSPESTSKVSLFKAWPRAAIYMKRRHKAFWKDITLHWLSPWNVKRQEVQIPTHLRFSACTFRNIAKTLKSI
jgi:hypothetical protein